MVLSSAAPSLPLKRYFMSQTCWEMAETCGISWLAYDLSFMKCFMMIGVPGGRGKPAAAPPEPPFELRHEGLARQAGRDRREELDGDGAGALDELAAAPEKAGIDRHRDHRQAELAIEGGDARLVGPMLARGRARPLRIDQQRPSLRRRPPGGPDHAAERAGLAGAIDRDHAGTQQQPAEERDPGELALQHIGGLVEQQR